MAAYADLEIGLHLRDGNRYRVDLRFSHPDSDVDIRSAGRGPLEFDFARLRALVHDDKAYGQLLSESLFADQAMKTAFAKARSAAQALDAPLRLRLFVGPSAPGLHGLRWETLRDPEDGSCLLTGEQILFSRYLSSSDWRPLGPSPKAHLRALVALANPAGLDDYQPGGRSLAPLDVDGELKRAKAGLADIPVAPLASRGTVTLEGITQHLRDGYDILYLACHGALVDDLPHLWLEDEGGGVQVVAGDELVEEMKGLQRRPRLIVLASCQSAGQGEAALADDGGALAALGPRLAEAGIPAVLAMQGNISMQTVTQFMPIFFQELQRDGQIDRAMATARGAVGRRPDWWMPVLFMRLKSGRLWYAPGFGGELREWEKWRALVRNIRRGKCTPILGPGLMDTLLGSRQQIAHHWAETYYFPMAAHDRENLPQVAQFLAVNEGSMFLCDELADYVFNELLDRYARDLPEGMDEESLHKLISVVGAKHRTRDPKEPHRVFSQLPLPIYITATFNDLLAEALSEMGKDPHIELCRWKGRPELLPSLYDGQRGYKPSTEQPLVYHLFGRLQEPASIVLTEDDYFDFLIGATRNKDLIPAVVRGHLASTQLLFVGFRMDDWEFRVLLRWLMSQEGKGKRHGYTHVAVQIDPEEGRIQDPERARRYLERRFGSADISIYWGSVEHFVQELDRCWRESRQ